MFLDFVSIYKIEIIPIISNTEIGIIFYCLDSLLSNTLPFIVNHGGHLSHLSSSLLCGDDYFSRTLIVMLYTE